jgi:hypothetical protein
MTLVAEETQKWPFGNGDQMYHKTRNGDHLKSTINELLPDAVVDGHELK